MLATAAQKEVDTSHYLVFQYLYMQNLHCLLGYLLWPTIKGYVSGFKSML